MSWEIYEVGKFIPVEVAIRYDRVSRAVVEWECPRCRRDIQWVTEDDKKIAQLENWADGTTTDKNIQEAMPDIPADVREVFLSGICQDCWNEMFHHPEEL